MPAWYAASLKVAQLRVRSCAGTAPGSVLELPAGKVTEAPDRVLFVNSLRISAPAALTVLCPELDSCNGGVGTVVGWYGAQASPAIALVPRYEPAHPSTCCASNR